MWISEAEEPRAPTVRNTAVGCPLPGASLGRAFLQDHQAGRPLPCFQGWVCRYPWELWESLSVQHAIWVIPEQPMSHSILYWVHLSLLSNFTEWGHGPSAAEMKHRRLLKLTGSQISSLWPPKTLPICWTISLTYYYCCCCYCYYWMWPLYGVEFE